MRVRVHLWTIRNPGGQSPGDLRPDQRLGNVLTSGSHFCQQALHLGVDALRQGTGPPVGPDDERRLFLVESPRQPFDVDATIREDLDEGALPNRLERDPGDLCISRRGAGVLVARFV